VLAEKGFISEKDMNGFAQNGGTLEQHPNHDLKRGIEVSSGSLGHGLSVGAGMALAGKIDRRNYRTCVLLSDGELNEGSVWEAVMFAAHHRLSKLIALVDRNRMQALGRTADIIDLDPLGRKWKSFGWHTQEVDGHDFDDIFKALNNLSPERPNVIILNTVKGKGVSFMENELLWHYRCPDKGEYVLAVEELAR
jgi:transketolase